jgi:hypothetical protein
MTFLQWWGILIVAWIGWGVASSTLKAVRENRFGIRHMKKRALLSALVGVIMSSLFFYGWFKYPDAPIHACAGPTGYCGKQGQQHTLVEYQWFSVWQTSLFLIWPFGMLALFLLNRNRPNLDSGSST